MSGMTGAERSWAGNQKSRRLWAVASSKVVMFCVSFRCECNCIGGRLIKRAIVFQFTALSVLSQLLGGTVGQTIPPSITPHPRLVWVVTRTGSSVTGLMNIHWMPTCRSHAYAGNDRL